MELSILLVSELAERKHLKDGLNTKFGKSDTEFNTPFLKKQFVLLNVLLLLNRFY